MFHWRDGWFFTRLQDGSVRIDKRETGNENSELIVTADILATEWASIVASMSIWGDHNPFYQMALTFHGEVLYKYPSATTASTIGFKARKISEGSGDGG